MNWRKVLGWVALVVGVFGFVMFTSIETGGMGDIPRKGLVRGLAIGGGAAIAVFLLCTLVVKVSMTSDAEWETFNLISVGSWVLAQILVFLGVGRFAPLTRWVEPAYFFLVILQPFVDLVDLVVITKKKIVSDWNGLRGSLVVGLLVLTIVTGFVSLEVYTEVYAVGPAYTFPEEGIFIDVEGGENVYILKPSDMVKVEKFVRTKVPYYGLTAVLIYTDEQGYSWKRYWYPEIPDLGEPRGKIYLVDNLKDRTILATAWY